MQKTVKKILLRSKNLFWERVTDLHIYKCKQNSHWKPQKMTQNIRKPLSLPLCLSGKKNREIIDNIFKTSKVIKNLKSLSLQNKIFSIGLSGVQVEVHDAKNKDKLPPQGLPVHPRVGSNVLQWKVLHEVTLLFNIGSIMLYNKHRINFEIYVHLNSEAESHFKDSFSELCCWNHIFWAK